MKKILLILNIICVQIVLAAPSTLPIDTVSSYISWTGSKIIGSHNGTVTLKSGQVVMEENKLVGGEFVIDMNSIVNNDLAESPRDQAKLVSHLKSIDFFNVPKFPDANFVIEEVSDHKKSAVLIKGTLTVKGISNKIEFPAITNSVDGKYNASANFKIDRTKWDIKYNSKSFFDPKKLGDRLIYDDIEIKLAINTK